MKENQVSTGKIQMLINAQDEREVRVALVRDNKLYNLDIERADVKKQKGNIYLARITKITPGLGAAFVVYTDDDTDRHGFLPLKEIAPTSAEGIDGKIYEGKELLLQVEKEQRSNKGASLTTSVALVGSFLVLMPNRPRISGISKRIDGNNRAKLKELIEQLKIPKGMGIIVRTAGTNKTLAELQWDLDLLVLHWEAIQSAAKKLKAPCLIHQEQNIIIRTLRDYLHQDVQEVLVDSKDAFETIKSYLQQVQPSFVERLHLHQSDTPLFEHANIEDDIATIFQHEVSLPSGGTIVIDHTEALVSVDVNSARANKGESIEETALQTNLEATEELARQLRLRDIGGLIVVDFIDMLMYENQHLVENRLYAALASDRAHTQIGRISKRFGLLIMSRQRLRTNLTETGLLPCTSCKGRGMVYGIEPFTTLMLRHIKGQAAKVKRRNKNVLQVQVPTEVATFLFNEKRQAVVKIEEHYGIHIMIIPNPHFNIPLYKIKLAYVADKGGARTRGSTKSYKLIETPLAEEPTNKVEFVSEKPAVAISITSPKPPSKKVCSSKNFIERIWLAIFGSSQEKKPEKTHHHHGKPKKHYHKQGSRSHHTNHYRGHHSTNKSRQKTIHSNKNK